MGDLNQITAALDHLFTDEGQRIVLWNDPKQEFVDTLPAIHLDNVNNVAPGPDRCLGGQNPH